MVVFVIRLLQIVRTRTHISGSLSFGRTGREEQTGYITADKKSNASSGFYWMAKRMRLLTDSILYTILHGLEQIIGLKIPITILTYSEIMFKFILEEGSTTERRLMIDILSTPYAYVREKRDAGWISTDDTVADGMSQLATFKSLD